MSYLTRLPNVPDRDDVKRGMAFYEGSGRAGASLRQLPASRLLARRGKTDVQQTDRPCLRRSGLTAAAAVSQVHAPSRTTHRRRSGKPASTISKEQS